MQLSAALFFLSLAALASGCVYDWEVGAPAPDGSGGAGAGSGGAGAGGDGAAGGAGAGSGGGGAGGSAPDCDALTEDVKETRASAKACTLGASGQCGGSIEDECGCTSYVQDQASLDTAAYEAAVAALVASGCSIDCSMCLSGSGTCLLENGMGPYCLP